MLKFKVNPDQAGSRLDVFLTGRLGALSRSSVHKLISENKATVDGDVKKSNYKVSENDLQP